MALLIISPSEIFSQYILRIKPVDKDDAFIDNTLKLQTNFRSKTQCTDYVSKLGGLLHSKGFISASVDSVWYDSTTAGIHLYTGNALRWALLRTDSVEKVILTAVNWNKKEFENKPLQLDQLQALQKNILNYLENNGYPFAKISLDSIGLQDDVLQAILKVDKGPLYKIDSIRNNGTATISSRFLQRYLNILNGSTYRKDNLLSISRKINELPFAQEQQPWSLTLLGTGSIVNLNLSPKKNHPKNQ